MGSIAPRIYEGKLAIVTGSARGLSTIPCSQVVPLPLRFPSLGIGSAIVRNLASKGSNVVINYATEGSDAPAAALAAELEQTYSIRALPLRADITSRSECERLVSATKEHFRHPLSLIHISEPTRHVVGSRMPSSA